MRKWMSWFAKTLQYAIALTVVGMSLGIGFTVGMLFTLRWW